MDFSGIVKWVAGSIDLFKILAWVEAHPGMWLVILGAALMGWTLWANAKTEGKLAGFTLWSLPGVAASLIALMLVGFGFADLTGLVHFVDQVH